MAEAGVPPAAEVYRLLARRVVPELQRILVQKDTVRAPVALAGAPPWLPAACCLPCSVLAGLGWAGCGVPGSDAALGGMHWPSVARRCSPHALLPHSPSHPPHARRAVVKVLQLLPEAAMRMQLPRTLQKVANLLRARMQSTRCVGTPRGRRSRPSPASRGGGHALMARSPACTAAAPPCAHPAPARTRTRPPAATRRARCWCPWSSSWARPTCPLSARSCSRVGAPGQRARALLGLGGGGGGAERPGRKLAALVRWAVSHVQGYCTVWTEHPTPCAPALPCNPSSLPPQGLHRARAGLHGARGGGGRGGGGRARLRGRLPAAAAAAHGGERAGPAGGGAGGLFDGVVAGAACWHHCAQPLNACQPRTSRRCPAPLFVPTTQADLFGDVAEAKEAAEFAGAYKEARKCRAYETYQLLAGLVTFGQRIPELLTTVQVGSCCTFGGVWWAGARSGWRAGGWGVQGCAARIEVSLRRAGCKHSQTPSVRRAIQPNRAHAPPPAVTQSRLGAASHPKTRAKLASLLQHAARGVLGNPTGEPPLGLATGGTYSQLNCMCLKCGSTPASAGDTAQLATACSAPLPPHHRHPASQPPPRTSASSSSPPPTRGWRRRRRRASGPRPPRAPRRPAPTVRLPDASRRPQGHNGVLRLR